MMLMILLPSDHLHSKIQITGLPENSQTGLHWLRCGLSPVWPFYVTNLQYSNGSEYKNTTYHLQ